MLGQIFSSMATIVIMISLGYVLQIKGWFDKNFSASIASLIIKIALPASIMISVLRFISKEKMIEFVGSLGIPLLSVIIGYLLAWIIVQVFRIPNERKATVMNTIVNANTIFMGMPLNLSLFGEEAMPYFLVYYVVNTLSTFTVGSYLFAYYNQQHVGKGIQWSRIFLNQSLIYIGNLVTPLSLMYIGIHLAQVGLRSLTFNRDMTLSIFGRFVLFPVILLTVQVGAMQLFSVELPMKLQETFFLQSTIPTLVIMPLLATEENADVDFATSAVTITTLLYIVILPVWMMLFSIAFQ